ncbi:PP2C family serine/threonine-protein phosphatase [Stutzerimonas stutzeri]|jgi:serine/threonine protein phosphatase PrpC|uniref:PP2C family serine/threonine-protein phosphatase n=1 Tax=Stutzerimonas stutzeri TaxID=316 RepID=UPI00244842BA|nr:PP2C family serine/threonine-protein phosphatase [Stutzerimonas stutzeri]MDH0122087.1 protein phosphatase 2C domain-containing protein [Stutzerimonas stutzeri]MDI9738498.1 PP2C family serine/threonine-protein phosphatase [Stutzerimonas stutzeri]
MHLSAGGASIRGPSHQLDDAPNQDALCVSGSRGGWCVAVADGLGSRPLSHIGSQKAVQLFRQLARQRQDMPHGEVILALRDAWLAHFGDCYRAHETTCLWARVDASGRGAAGQVGDGLLLVKNQGVFQVLTDQRQGFGNQTTTLAQADTQGCCSTELELSKPGDGVLLMTDGISDDLIPEQLEPFFDAIYQRQLRYNKRRMRQWLTRELHNWSTPRHSDDKSIAGIFRTD